MTTCNYKNILSISVVVLLYVTIIAARPAPGREKIRIHVPVKHHTHYHTKTIIKEVHVPVKHHVVEEVHKPYKYHRSHHHIPDDDDDEDLEEDLYSRKPYLKKKKFHPFIKK